MKTHAEKLRYWAQNEEMVNENFLQHGYDCLRAADELDRLTRLVAQTEDRGSTHYEGCWDSGPRHYQCALNQIKRLQEQLSGPAEMTDAALENRDLREENTTLRNAQKACADCDAPTVAETARVLAKKDIENGELRSQLDIEKGYVRSYRDGYAHQCAEVVKMRSEIERLREAHTNLEKAYTYQCELDERQTEEIERLRGLLKDAKVPEWVIDSVHEALGGRDE